jgi:beta-lactamase regulating signal transducer with metallopeptidase domain
MRLSLLLLKLPYTLQTPVSKTVSTNEDTTHALATENSSLKANSSQMTRKKQTGKKDAICQLVSLEERKLQHFRQLHKQKEKSW